jgi:preprotein translocase subunit SecE
MATEEDAKEKELDDSAPPVEEQESDDAGADAPASDLARIEEEIAADERAEVETSDPDDAPPIAAPAQLGFRRFVYAAYFAGGIAIAFFLDRIVSASWARLAQWKPMLGEPRDEIVLPVSALVGVVAAFYYWRRTRARKLAEEVAEELSKVTWPDRDEVTSSTFVVIVATLVSTVFFALMDRFWGFLTNLVYGT